MRDDLFQRLPPPTALLVLAAILNSTSAHVLQPFPRQTPPPSTTQPLQALDVVSWPLVPTPAPLDPFDLRRRQIPATVCGYIGGDPELPATCSAGSHCVLDSAHGVIGCCPDGKESCSSGVFTGCVDANSGPQTEVNPYVFTCQGNNVCYKNQFDGGYSQFGCGTASDLGTTVLAAANGVTVSLDRQTASMDLTATASPLSEPTTLGTVTSRRSSSTSDSASSSSSTTESSSESSTESSSAPSSSPQTSPTTSPTTASSSNTRTATSSEATETSDPPAAPTAAPPPDRTGAIVGGTVSGVAALIAVAALGFFFYRRRQQNVRQGPGHTSPSGTYISAPKPGPGTGFTAIDQNSDAYERALLPPVSTAPNFSHDLSAGGPSPFAYRGAAGVHDSYPPAERVPSSNYSDYSYPGQFPAAYAAAAAAQQGHTRLEPDQIPLTREIDDFSHGFQQALGRIGEEDEPPYSDGNRGNGNGQFSDTPSVNEGNGVNGPPGDQEGYTGPVRPLWQQNRRQSRNLMWM